MTKDQKPAFFVVCGTSTGREMDPEYFKRATPIGLQTGLKPLAVGEVGAQVEVLEGELPEGTTFLAVEQFPSMEALKEFYNSEQYQSAIPFRSDAVTIHFLAAVDGISEAELLARAAMVEELVE
ncbi:DUF1330 domain-containing protein [Pseudomaricurvus alkylphenolicus]|jgi:uncharacterized protein (DUF1330 family)|uniref:DUF1330 domain-containing protein n=1 Tax=Pseudomaricurvus alkylphenolicus TaxID=1306991 RepID=UPI00141E67C1|nr:DUF1330 domain-containing protein [Pseudomaricurvus alkylphenolicus]NIB38133.1 DUF1330 domain-containing protein [Pseudomaricurvus alkylphenolicus]